MLTRGMDIAAKGMLSLIDFNDNIANNIANVNTTGFKKSTLVFKNVYDAELTKATDKDPRYADYESIGKISMGSETQKLITEFSQGALYRTGNTLDIAIEGDGFFKVQSPDGHISYTRNGNFMLNSKDMLVNNEGDVVIDVKDKPVKIDTKKNAVEDFKNITIGEDGTIEIVNKNTRTQLQQIKIVDFQDKENMIAKGASKYEPRDNVQNPELKAEKFKLQQGAVETANVNLVSEMINIINVSRNYETLSKFVKDESNLLSRAINLGRVSL